MKVSSDSFLVGDDRLHRVEKPIVERSLGPFDLLTGGSQCDREDRAHAVGVDPFQRGGVEVTFTNVDDVSELHASVLLG